MKRVVSFLSSLKLAVLLLVVLLLALAAGTIVESKAGVETAGRLVYFSPWFIGLQGLFAVNVALSLAAHLPWTRRRVGFVLTHGALLLILAGSLLTYLVKVEGNLRLWEGEQGSTLEQVDARGQVVSRHELPFTVKLEDFQLSTYPGTQRPSGFASQVVLSDKDGGKAFPARIWMNHPLHHRGYTFFQSSYQMDGGREATVLSVSKDPGQNVVFLGYALLVLGMIVVYTNRVRDGRTEGSTAAGWLLGALLLMGSAGRAQDLEALKRLPVQHDGRVMPLDTQARETLWTLTGKHEPQAVAEIQQWLRDPRTAANKPLIQIGSKGFVQALGLPAGTTHISFIQAIQKPEVGRLVQMAQMAEEEGQPLVGHLLEASKLASRVMLMKAWLFREALRPIPNPENLHARWSGLNPGDPDALATLLASPRQAGWPEAKVMDREVFYNALNPARWAWVLLLGSLLASVLAWIRPNRWTERIAWLGLVAGFGMMSWGIALRWQVAGRIPASNMYESLLFLAWGVGAFAVIANLFLRSTWVVLNAAAMATLTMMLTDLLPIDRFIHPMAPVLSGTPWLAIHVPIIMVGYAVLALSLVVAHLQLGVTMLRPGRTDLVDRFQELHYHYVFVGSLLLLVGILTGSVWAASSWGRWWGWDPKEVWSLVAFLAYMAILHARIERWIGTFGVAVLSILSFQTILMTYLGVNFVLTTGMHSYGMGDSPVVFWMVLVGTLEVAFVAVALLVRRMRSVRQAV